MVLGSHICVPTHDYTDHLLNGLSQWTRAYDHRTVALVCTSTRPTSCKLLYSTLYSHICDSCLFCRGIDNIQNGIGPQVGLFIRGVAVLLGGTVWAFVISWKLALVVATMLPVIAALTALNIRVRLLLTCTINICT